VRERKAVAGDKTCGGTETAATKRAFAVWRIVLNACNPEVESVPARTCGQAGVTLCGKEGTESGRITWLFCRRHKKAPEQSLLCSGVAE